MFPEETTTSLREVQTKYIRLCISSIMGKENEATDEIVTQLSAVSSGFYDEAMQEQFSQDMLFSVEALLRPCGSLWHRDRPGPVRARGGHEGLGDGLGRELTQQGG